MQLWKKNSNSNGIKKENEKLYCTATTPKHFGTQPRHFGNTRFKTDRKRFKNNGNGSKSMKSMGRAIQHGLGCSGNLAFIVSYNWERVEEPLHVEEPTHYSWGKEPICTLESMGPQKQHFVALLVQYFGAKYYHIGTNTTSYHHETLKHNKPLILSL